MANSSHSALSEPSQIETLIERTERLLLRYEEQSRTNALLQAQVQSLSSERDSLKSRLSAARARIDSLIDRLPEQMADLSALESDA